MSSVKEPKFFTSLFLNFPFKGIGDDGVEKGLIKNYADYIKLFEQVKKEKAIGEASADYLYFYKNTILEIKRYLKNPKIIIILRNPVDRAFSAYTHLVRDNREFLSFEEGLKKEEERKNNNWEFIWYYKEVGLYYNQVKAYLENFDNVKIYLYDDLKKDRLGLVQDIYGFLEVDDSFVPENLNEKYNVSGVPKNKLIHNFFYQDNIIKTIIKPIAKAILPDRKKRQKIINKIIQKNLQKPEMKPETREYLKNYFRKDILKLQDLIDRDLSHWLK